MRSGSAILYKGGSVHYATKIVRHYKYQNTDDDFEICAVQVDPPFELNSKTTRAVDLPKFRDLHDVNWGLVSGWGFLKVKLA